MYKNNNNIGQELSEFKPVEIVGCEICEAGSPPSFNSEVVHSNDFRNAYYEATDNERKEFFELLIKKLYDAVY